MKKTNNDNATRVVRRKSDTIERIVRPYRALKATVGDLKSETLRIVPLGGQNGIGEKNMIVVEYGQDAIVLDCGFELGIDLPGINYAVPAVDYLKSIRHKVRGYIISHGHLDHIGALIHVIPEVPAPIFGSRFTIGMVEAQFEKLVEYGREPVEYKTQVVDMDAHEQVQLGQFSVELVRVTHAIPESSAIVVDTPVGRLINTGDFRLDPEPLDTRPSDIARLKQLGKEGVMLLMSESTNTTKLGRTPTEHTLQDSFYELIGQTKGRLVVAVFSTNMNRVQMIINAAHHYGRKVALDGRSMLAVAELAVKLGNLKIPKGTLVAMRDAVNLPDNEVTIICTGGQGEPGAALSRMAIGEHQFVKLKRGDSVVISSTAISGNERSYEHIGNSLAKIGVTQFRHPTHEIDGCGPLHVSGHASRDEHAEMIQLTQPTYLMPIYGGALHRMYHKGIGIAEGIKEDHIILAENGTVIEFDKTRQPKKVGTVTAGSLLVDQTGSVVPEIVTKDRLLLKDDGFMIVIVTVDTTTGKLVGSPDIITRGHIAVRDTAELVDGLRASVRRLVATRGSLRSRALIDTLKHDLKQHTTRFLFERTAKTPIVISVVNTIGHGRTNVQPQPVADVC